MEEKKKEKNKIYKEDLEKRAKRKERKDIFISRNEKRE